MSCLVEQTFHSLGRINVLFNNAAIQVNKTVEDTTVEEWNRETPWRLGHLLGDDAINALGLRHNTATEQTLAIVATHDCDLAQQPAGEPRIEVVVGCVAAEKRVERV